MSSIAAKLSVSVRIVVEVEHLQTELMLVQAAAGIAFVPGALARLSIDVSRRVNPSYWPYARARRAATGRAATELWGLCARPPAIEIGEGPRVNLTCHPHARARAFPQFSVPALMARQWSARCYGVARQREGSRQNSIGHPRVNLTCHPHARARAFPQFSVPALMARQWSARCYGVARQREGSRQNSIGPPALTLPVTLTRARELFLNSQCRR